MTNEEFGKKMVEFAQSYNGEEFITHGEGPPMSKENLESVLRTLKKYYLGERKMFVPNIPIVPRTGYG